MCSQAEEVARKRVRASSTSFFTPTCDIDFRFHRAPSLIIHRPYHPRSYEFRMFPRFAFEETCGLEMERNRGKIKWMDSTVKWDGMGF